MLPQDRKILRQHTRQNQNSNQIAASRRVGGKSGTPNRSNNNHHSKMNTNSKADPISLSFHDSCLRMSDVQLLRGPHWLNDQIISFYYEYLTHVKYKKNNDITFIAPEVTQCMKYMDDQELEQLMDQNNGTKKPFIFFAMNDNRSFEAGGTHWSLLVFSRPEKTFYHFDSYGNNNTSNSVELMNKVKETMDVRSAKFRPMRCLQQANGYDCGIHVICMTDHIADYLNRYEVMDGLPPLQVDSVKAKRTELLKLIMSLGGKG
ncbi:sentrin-specific protease 8 isoform X1 [Drosophila subobscura]|uniref:sentrin-specific protease 8 isoform X1 n=1 Tax=Drosophila subobscura TaxID=7241 RepID=UPI00155B2CE9|nr:sentrin-specific protease 8 isoform X1 [Drosophila subobscura]